MTDNRVCTLCLGINVNSLATTGGYSHSKTYHDLKISAATCLMCGVMQISLSHEKHPPKEEQRGIICRLHRQQDSLAFLEITAGPNIKGLVSMYTMFGDRAKDFGVQQIVDRTSKSSDWLTLQLAWRFMDTCIKEHDCGKLFRRPIDQSQLDQLPDSHQEDLDAVRKPKKPPPLDDLPARLIYLDKFGERCLDACLVEVPDDCKQSGTHIDYAALSYCWGPNPDTMYKTTKETLGSRMNRIVWSELPKTVQDAITIARRLAIPCLWIDAICIIQDSKTDWEQESAKMGAIYASAVVTIAADASSSVDGGILDIVDSETGTYNGHVQIPAILEDGSTSKLMFYNRQSSIPGIESTLKAVLDSPLSSRAWCLQERILSSRILHFTKQGLVCECRKQYFCIHMVWPVDHVSQFRTVPGMLRMFYQGLPELAWGLKVGVSQTSSLTENHLKTLDHVAKMKNTIYSPYKGDVDNPKIKKGDQEELVRWWNKNVVTEYSRRRLTLESDKLAAISSIASVFGLYIDSQYVAGLWLVGIEESLEWRRAGTPYGTRKLSYPSFSWLSHPGSVSWPYLWHMRPHGKAFTVVEAHTELAGPNPYGSLVSTSLTLHGRLRNVVLGPKVQSENSTSYHSERYIADDFGEIIGEVELDFDEMVDELQCFHLYRNSHGFLRLLLLQKTESETQNQYKRAGIGFVYPRHGSWLEQAENQTVQLI